MDYGGLNQWMLFEGDGFVEVEGDMGRGQWGFASKEEAYDFHS